MVIFKYLIVIFIVMKWFVFLIAILLCIDFSSAALEKNVNFVAPWVFESVDIKIFGNAFQTDSYDNVLKNDSITADLSGSQDSRVFFGGEWYLNGGTVTSPELVVDNDLFNLFESLIEGDYSRLLPGFHVRYACCEWQESEVMNCSTSSEIINCSRDPGVMIYLFYKQDDSIKQSCYSDCSSRVNGSRENSSINNYADCLNECFRERGLFENDEEAFEYLLNNTRFHKTIFGADSYSSTIILCKIDNGLWCSSLTYFRRYSSTLRVSKPVLVFTNEELVEEFGVSPDSLIYYNPESNSLEFSEEQNISTNSILNFTSKLNLKINSTLLTNEESELLEKLTSLKILDMKTSFKDFKLLLSFDLENTGVMPVIIKSMFLSDGNKTYSVFDLQNEKTIVINTSSKKDFLLEIKDFCDLVGKKAIFFVYYSPYNYLGTSDFIFNKSLEIKFDNDLFSDYYTLNSYYPEDDFFVYEAQPSINKNNRIDLHVGNKAGILRSFIKLNPLVINTDFKRAFLKFNVLKFDNNSSISIYSIPLDFDVESVNYAFQPRIGEFVDNVYVDKNGSFYVDVTKSVKEGCFGFLIRAFDENSNSEVVINSLESTNKPRILTLKPSSKKHNLLSFICD